MHPPPPPTVGVLLLAMVLLLSSPVGHAGAAPLAGDHGPPDQPAETHQVPADRGGAVRPVPGAIVRHFEAPQGPYGPGHRGVDLVAHHGATVRSALGGTVVFSGQVAGVGWVTVDHGGLLVTTYGPLQDRVPSGSAVAAGQVLGLLDRPEAPGPTHLDWGARLDGDYVDPLQLLARWRLHLTVLPRCDDREEGC